MHLFVSLIWAGSFMLCGLLSICATPLALVWAYNVGFGPLQIAAIVVAGLIDFGSNSEAERRRRKRERA